MVRTPWFDKNGMKKGAWSEEEDNKLRSYIESYGHWNWRLLPIYAGLARCGKSCRLRWMNYLRPSVKHGHYIREEEDLIMKLHDELGNKWAAIAIKLPGRTDNEIKNYWHTHLKKRTKRNQNSCKSIGTSKSEENHKEKPHGISHFQSKKEKELAYEVVLQQASSSDFSSPNSDKAILSGTRCAFEDGICSTESNWEPIENFWTDPFLVESDNFITNNFMAPLILGHGLLCPSSPIIAEQFLRSFDLPNECTGTFY